MRTFILIRTLTMKYDNVIPAKHLAQLVFVVIAHVRTELTLIYYGLGIVYVH